METMFFILAVIANLLAASVKADERNTSGVILHIFMIVMLSIYYYLSKNL